jgi:ABC-type nitrate/sulfonate/bicarbonate transport system permease component
LTGFRRRARPHLESWLSAAIAAAGLVTWEWLVSAGALSALFFPAPSTIAWTVVRMFVRGDLAIQLGATLARLLLGLALGGGPGLVLGLTMGWSPRLRGLVDPFVAATYPIPKIAILPLIMLIFGVGEPSIVAVIAASTCYPLLINSMAGVRQINPIYFEVAENYGAGRVRLFTRVILPGSLPSILSGARIAMNTALLVTIAVEIVTAQQGLGAMIWLAWQTLHTEEIYASLFLIVVLGIGLNWLLQALSARLLPWQVERET